MKFGGNLKLIRLINCLDLRLLLQLMSLPCLIHFFGFGTQIPKSIIFWTFAGWPMEHKKFERFFDKFEAKYPHNKRTYPRTRANINKGHSWPEFFFEFKLCLEFVPSSGIVVFLPTWYDDPQVLLFFRYPYACFSVYASSHPPFSWSYFESSGSCYGWLFSLQALQKWVV